MPITTIHGTFQNKRDYELFVCRRDRRGLLLAIEKLNARIAQLEAELDEVNQRIAVLRGECGR
jgi:uncharacterized small protein (DUF1192 family)